MSRRPRYPDPRERGFVLVGVIMFVLALTILGLSLYSLSGFEVDFIQDSIARQQAYYDASGGLERAKWILAQQGTLQSAKVGIPDGYGVVNVNAWYPNRVNKDSAGTINWDSSEHIAIRVKAVGGTRQGQTGTASCIVECQYTPVGLRSLYSNLITTGGTFPTSGQVVVGNGPGTLLPITQGFVWQNSTDSSWTADAIRSAPKSVTLGGAPDPDVSGFFSRFPALFPTVANPQYIAHYQTLGAKKGVYQLYAPNGYPVAPGIRMFRDSDEPASADLDFQIWNQDDDATIQISAPGNPFTPSTAIWMIQKGARLAASLKVVGNPGSRLIIIAERGTEPPYFAGMRPIGLWFDAPLLFSGSTVPIILVSDGTIAFSQTTHVNATIIPWISVFASDVQMTVQTSLGVGGLSLSHDNSQDSSILDDLISLQLLPNVSPGQNRRLDRIAGTWSLVTPSDPGY